MKITIKTIFMYVFTAWSVIIGILVIVTGSFHFVYNSAGSFLIQGFKTNPTLAMILVAVALLVMGLLTIIYPFSYFVFKREPITERLPLFTLWYFILACLTFFISGIFGIIVGSLCFVSAVVLLICAIISKIPNATDMQRLDTEDTEKNANTLIQNPSEEVNSSITSNGENNFDSNSNSNSN